MDPPEKVCLNSEFEDVTFNHDGKPKCKCGLLMKARVKALASEPITDDDRFWRCRKPRKYQCESIIWFNEFDQVKRRLDSAAVPRTPGQSRVQRGKDAYPTPSSNEKLNKSASIFSDARSASKRPETPLGPTTTPTKKSKTERQLLGTPNSGNLNRVKKRDSSVSNSPPKPSKSALLMKKWLKKKNDENLQPFSSIQLTSSMEQKNLKTE